MPPSSLRQAPCPLHCSAARASPPSTPKSSSVRISAFTVAGLSRRLSANGGVSTILPGLSSPCGSHSAFSSRKARVSSGPNMRSREDAAHDAVAVLPAERAAELQHQVRHLLRQPLRLLQPLRVLQVDDRPDVQAADARVSVVRGAQPPRPHERHRIAPRTPPGCSGATAVSSTNDAGFASPRRLISRPRPASRIRHMRCLLRRLSRDHGLEGPVLPHEVVAHPLDLRPPPPPPAPPANSTSSSAPGSPCTNSTSSRKPCALATTLR